MKTDNSTFPGKSESHVRTARVPKPKLTAAALFDYANNYARAEERAGNGTEYPTIRMAALHFKVTQEAIRSSIEDYSGKGYLGVAVGARYGNRIGLYGEQSHRVEAYGDDEENDE